MGDARHYLDHARLAQFDKFRQYDLGELADHLRGRAGVDAEDAGVAVGVVEGRGRVHPVVVVEDVGVEARVHALQKKTGV